VIPDEALGGLPVELLDRIRSELSHYPAVHKAVLFGSRAMGTQRFNSEIDLCLDAPQLPFETFLQLDSELDEQGLPYRLDLVIRHHIENPNLLAHISRVGVVLYQCRVVKRSASHHGFMLRCGGYGVGFSVSVASHGA